MHLQRVSANLGVGVSTACRIEPQWNTQQVVYGQDEVLDLCNMQPTCMLQCEMRGHSRAQPMA
jgi:hypothetical protein